MFLVARSWSLTAGLRIRAATSNEQPVIGKSRRAMKGTSTNLENHPLSPEADLQAYYLDGQTAVRRRAKVGLTRTGLRIVLENGEALFWPFEAVRQSSSFYGREQIRLERGGDTPEILLVPASLFVRKVKEVSPEWKGRFRAPARRKKIAAVVLLSIAGATGVTLGLYFWGIPALASYVTPHVPVAWEEQLGQSVIDSLAPAEKRCLDSARAQKLERILKILSSSAPQSPYSFRVMVVNYPAVNAFAAPGGTIVLFQGLLERTRSSEELAGVLAHEMQHILRRHATRALLQQLSMKFILAAATGDATGLAYGLEGASALGMLRYNRQSEEEADREAVRMLLASGIDPRGLIIFFETLQRENEKSLRLPSYLSTHPELKERVLRLKALTAGRWTAPARLLPEYDWKDMGGFCPAKPENDPQEKKPLKKMLPGRSSF
jgi:Zn-dependent protease with chaperone function